jgi:hypothetical protein
MSTIDPDDLERIDREIRINELKHEAEELAGGEMTTFESEDMPTEMAEAFWQHVVEYEKAPWTSLHEQLANDGLVLPPADTLTDEQISAKLGELIRWMAARRNFLHNTNHLSDRELYEHLINESLHEAMKDIPYDEYSAYEIDLLGSGSDEDTQLYLKYYADEQWRQDWHARWPEDLVPPHEDPPYDRDRHLPKAEYPHVRGGEEEDEMPRD